MSTPRPHGRAHRRAALSFVAAAIAAASAAGCRSQPIPTDVRTLVTSPEAFEDERVEVTAPVAENTYASDGAAVWRLRLGRETETILAIEDGMNAAVIRNASELADAAGRAGQPVTVVGIFRTGSHGAYISGARIELESIRYRDEAVDTDYGDWSPYPYYGPYYWGWGPTFYGRAVWIDCD
jgi:hypothetical protein